MKTKSKKLALLAGATLLVALAFLFFYQRAVSPPAPRTENVSGRPPLTPNHLSGRENKGNVSVPGTVKQTGDPTKKIPAGNVESTTPDSSDVPEAIRPAVDRVTALKRWEDRLALYTEEGAKERVKATPVTVNEQEELRNFFSDLSPAAQIENIHHAMNLLPDETVEVVFGILFDTSQSPEVLNAIFHDVLNRDEAIKNPMMETIAKDKTHPMYVESARILDIVKE